MRSETQLVQDFAHQAAVDLQSVLPALQVWLLPFYHSNMIKLQTILVNK